ncbi:hypothetical protein Vadar_000915 [Vaccinium darrowii]|uniref:Uncharacterized protein n=1 Tax=Vaccinium darrowii TaxID=229202 RepID=A0ACB7YRV4_9ERIC|nr:hypothetical protein Vadar_000915 [Vaccinium darrowii]
MLLVHPEPVPPNHDDSRWSWFQNCLGALDGTFVPVYPPAGDKARYRTRKGEVATNVLGVCSRDLQFVYVLSGWEGSATDSRILRDAIARPNGLKVPHGQYYLTDADILHVSGFYWSDVNKCIVVDEASVWEDYEKAHKKVKGFNGRAFPYYDDCCCISELAAAALMPL